MFYANNWPIISVTTLTILLLAGSTAHQAHAKTEPLGRDALRAMVVTEALDLGLPVALALAVAHAESNFDSNALSHKGARGVMQIMPATARSEYGIEKNLLWQPRINIRLGIHFLHRLILRYHGRVNLALSHYNGGSAVGAPPRARVIPATRKYVKRVQVLRQRYRREVWSGGYRQWTHKTPDATSLRPD